MNFRQDSARVVAKKLSITTAEYLTKRALGLNFCRVCKLWLPNSEMSGRGFYCIQHFRQRDSIYRRKRRIANEKQRKAASRG